MLIQYFNKIYLLTNSDATIHVLLGALNITDNTEVGRVDLISDFYFIHPNYTNATGANDIVVIHLPRAINPSRKYVCSKLN